MLPRPAMWNIGAAQKYTLSGLICSAWMQVSDWASRFEWDRMAPLGLPVVPEVYMIRAGVSSGTSAPGCGSPGSAISDS